MYLDCVDVQGSYAAAAAAAADPDWGEEATGGWGYEDEGPAQARQFKVPSTNRMLFPSRTLQSTASDHSATFPFL